MSAGEAPLARRHRCGASLLQLHLQDAGDSSHGNTNYRGNLVLLGLMHWNSLGLVRQIRQEDDVSGGRYLVVISQEAMVCMRDRGN